MQTKRKWEQWLLSHRPPAAPWRLKNTVIGALYGAIGFVLTSAPLLFSANPLPLALLCAADGSLGWVLCGIALALWTSPPQGALWILIAALVVPLLRALARLCLTPPRETDLYSPAELREMYCKQGIARLCRLCRQGAGGEGDAQAVAKREASAAPALPSLYDEPLALRVSVALLASLIPGIALPVTGGFSYYDLYGAVLFLLITPLATALFALGLPILPSLPSAVLTRRRWPLIGCAFLLGSLAFCGRSLSVLGLSPTLAATVALMLWLLGEIGLLGGGIVALLCGTAYDIRVVPALFCLCLFYALLRGVIGTFSLLPGGLAACIALMLIGDPNALPAVAPTLFVGILLYWIALRYQARSVNASSASPSPADPTLQLLHSEQNRHRRMIEQMCAMAGAFGNLSEVFRRLDSSTYASPGQIKKSPAEPLSGTPGEQFSELCDATAHLLRDLVREDEPPGIEENESTRARITAYLSQRHIPAREVIVCGRADDERQTVQLLGVTPENLSASANDVDGHEQLQRELSALIDRPLSPPRYDAGEEGMLTLYTLPTLRADYVHRSIAAEEGERKHRISGDSVRVFEGEDGMFYALICDGMGKGRAAALTSGVCGVFLERTLRAGVEIGTALRMLNHYLRSRLGSAEDEISSTVDLFTLNLYSGQAHFIKSGAAPSLLLRHGRLFRLSSHTFPIGILQAIDVQNIPFDVFPGDRILLMSDGVADSLLGEKGEENAPLWESTIMDDEDDDALIRRLCSHARAQGSTDDMSMIAIRIGAERDSTASPADTPPSTEKGVPPATGAGA